MEDEGKVVKQYQELIHSKNGHVFFSEFSTKIGYFYLYVFLFIIYMFF